MGTPNYHHGDLRKTLIQAAMRSVESEGAQSVRMRELAKLTGVSVAAPYRHFRDRDELLSAVAAAGHWRLMQQMEDAAASQQSALRQFRAHGVAVVLFAVANPHLFRLMNNPIWSAAHASPEMAEARRVLDQGTTELLERARATQELSAGSVASQHLAASAMIYGLARMFVDGQMEAWGVGDESAEEMAEAVVDVLGLGLVPR